MPTAWADSRMRVIARHGSLSNQNEGHSTDRPTATPRIAGTNAMSKPPCVTFSHSSNSISLEAQAKFSGFKWTQMLLRLLKMSVSSLKVRVDEMSCQSDAKGFAHIVLRDRADCCIYQVARESDRGRELPVGLLDESVLRRAACKRGR
jgi:hypothetical protein